MFVYRNATTGQTVESEDRLPRLDGLARWERTEQTNSKPTSRQTTRPAEDDPTEPTDTIGGDAGPRRTRSRKASK